jgi:BirA family biotin operon repressor/biotin-[acetyl-CoA-carboxylase] ligase
LPQQTALNTIGTPFIELQLVDSTNNYARSLINDGLAKHGTVIFAHEQNAGKGQRGKVWTTEKNANVILSIAVNPEPLKVSQQFQLSACVATAVNDFFAKYASDETKIKWPNDLYWQDRKAGGILMENIIGSQKSGAGSQKPERPIWQWAIIGVGININQTVFPSELHNPVSLKQITGKDFDVIVLAKELCQLLEEKFRQLIAGDFENIFSQYLFHLYKKNEIVKLKKDNRVFEAFIKGVSPSGKLIVQHSIEEEFEFGEVEWVK